MYMWQDIYILLEECVHCRSEYGFVTPDPNHQSAKFSTLQLYIYSLHQIESLKFSQPIEDLTL